MNKLKLNSIFKINNSFLISPVIIIIYSAINPELFSLSIDRVSYHQVFNAINWPLNQTWPFLTGLTAWTPTEEFKHGIYLVEIISYLPALLARLVLNTDTVFQLQRIIDIAVIIGAISLFAELISKEIVRVKDGKHEIILKSLIIGSFICSPWAAYLIYKSTWHEPLFMLIVVSAMTALCRNKIRLGTILLAISSLIHYQYMFFMSIYFILSCILAIFNRQGKKTIWRLPRSIEEGINKNYQKLLWSSIGIIMFPFHHVRKLIAVALMGLPTNSVTGSPALIRIGLDGNTHSGGLLGSLQFLGGYKWYYCVSINNVQNKNILNLSNRTISAIVNCELILLTMILFSAISIYGVIMIYKSNKEEIKIANQWVTTALIFSFSGMLLVFQQSFTVHIVGYSYVWAFIFALGFSYIIYRNFIIREMPWKIAGLIIYASCINSLIQASFNVTKIKEIHSYFF